MDLMKLNCPFKNGTYHVDCILPPSPPTKKQDDQAVKSLGIMSLEYSSCPVLLPAHVMQEDGAVAP